MTDRPTNHFEEHVGALVDPSVGRLRPLLLEVWFPDGPALGWHVVSLRGSEAISKPYEFEVELFNDDPTIDHAELLGIDCELLLERNGLMRTVFGVVAEVELLTSAEAHQEQPGLNVRIRVVPAFGLLDQVIDTRFFAGQTVLEILRDVLPPALAQYDRQVDCESRIKGQYNRRDYCVQFRESTFAFCSRIMEEEGIAYVFVPDVDGQAEKLVLVDNNEDLDAAELIVPGAVPIVLSRAEELDRESIQAFDWRSKQTPNRIVTRGYNMKSPSPPDHGEAERTDGQRPVVREIYLDGDRRQIIDDPIDDPEAQTPTNAALAQRGSMATRALQRHTLESAIGRGRSNASDFAAGLVFTLGGHPDSTLAQHKFVLVRVVHEAEAAGDPELPSHTYSNRFECIPFERPFRPALRTPRPRVYGVQTGVVVGRVQDEVYTDQFGRVRVKFHRDRHSADDEYASCWIRVAQQWAGPGYGSVVIPRVGMEVIVSFVDGNPDCPLVTGCVYNGANMPPYSLPEDLSKSTFKTSSTPGGDGFNELRIEDAQGSEQIFVHAERRMDLRVRGSLFETAGGSREERVGGGPDGERHGDHNTLVHKDVNHRVMETRYVKVDKEHYASVGEDAIEDYQRRHMVFVNELSQLSAPRIVVEASDYISQKSNELELAGSSKISVKGGGKVVIESNNAIELKVGGSFISITPDGIDIQGLMLRLNSGGGVGSATEGIPALAMDILDPLDALAADDGRPGGGGSRGSGSGGGRSRTSRTLEPHHAPKMKPPPPAKPGEPKVLPDGTVRQLLSIAWLEEEAWCSEPATLTGIAKNYAGETELVGVINAVDGALQTTLPLPLGDGTYEQQVDIVDLLPRWRASGFETVRPLLAQVAGLTTPEPIQLRFIADLPQIRHSEGFGRFSLYVKNYEVVFGGTIRYVRGQIYRIIQLDGVVPSMIGGKLGVKIAGQVNWRYCKSTVKGSGSLADMVYWNGLGWVPVPPVKWNVVDQRKRLSGVGVWVENGIVKTQYGGEPWPGPDPVPEWSKQSLDMLEFNLNEHKASIMGAWSGTFDIKRQECRSHDPQCCRYMTRCELRFEEAETLVKGGIILGESNTGRASGTRWPIDGTGRTWAHEFGHHLGNPDEYEGSRSVDPSVNTDGAKAGIDPSSLMGEGNIVKRRHYGTICEALAKLVHQETGRSYTYTAVTVVSP